ncbi:hypothetical protein AK830_g177 [Neonectria ditissima]|uniref:Zn(2)-C6 fungal-type domain-containing protein n=1 Tax=Neonectria ditissima TaxID=78410 RepID=A0A0N8H965_9HYPO|nr:hypothetical protein AK830_g177 [Neonectria ditissima]
MTPVFSPYPYRGATRAGLLGQLVCLISPSVFSPHPTNTSQSGPWMAEDLGHLGSGVPRRRRYAPRSRVGCVTCRHRRKRCPAAGEQRECEACQRLNLECVWDAKRRLSALDAPGIHPPPSSSPSPSPSPSPTDIGPLCLDDIDQRIITSYYIHSFVPNISVASIPTNFLTCVYVPMAFHCDAVRHALLACASAHLSQAAADPTRQNRLLELSSRYQMKCHKFLQGRISPSGHLQRDVLESMAVILMLVGVEVQNGARTSTWMDQLKCVRNIVRQHGGRAAFCRGSWEASCLYQHFLYHDVMSLIMSGASGKEMVADDGLDEDPVDDAVSAPGSVSMQTDMPWEKYISGQDAQPASPKSAMSTCRGAFDSVHPLLGVSTDLFFLFQKIRQVQQVDQMDKQSSLTQMELFQDLEHKISAIQFDTPSITETNATPTHLDAATRLDLLTLAETHRLAALIMLYRRSTAHAHQLPVLARRLLAVADNIPSESLVEVGLTCPLFLAGAELDSETDTLQCATRLCRIRKRVKVMNILSAEKVLEEVWRERSKGCLLWDWEHVLRKRQWVINLA